MYKIMTKLHTMRENVFAFHMVPTDKDEDTLVEYKVATPEEAKEMALTLLGRVGYEDLRIVDDKSYYLDLLWGKKPDPAQNLYKLVFINNTEGYTADPYNKSDIEEEETVKVLIQFASKPESFHLVLDGKEYKTGIPKWIKYEDIDDTSCYLYFNGITRDHEVELIIDGETPPTPPVVTGADLYIGGFEQPITVSQFAEKTVEELTNAHYLTQYKKVQGPIETTTTWGNGANPSVYFIMVRDGLNPTFASMTSGGLTTDFPETDIKNPNVWKAVHEDVVIDDIVYHIYGYRTVFNINDIMSITVN